MRLQLLTQVDRFNAQAEDIHSRNVAAGWWHDLDTGAKLARNMGELLMLTITEIEEVLEAGDGRMDDKLPHRRGDEVELADAAIRLFDVAGGHDFDIQGAADELLSDPDNITLAGGGILGIIRELAAGFEGHRKGSKDKVLRDRLAIEVRTAAALLRIFYAGNVLGLDVPGAITEKLAFNATRADHKPENRRLEGGKKI